MLTRTFVFQADIANPARMVDGLSEVAADNRAAAFVGSSIAEHLVETLGCTCFALGVALRGDPYIAGGKPFFGKVQNGTSFPRNIADDVELPQHFQQLPEPFRGVT